METIGLVCLTIGLLLNIIYGISLIIKAFDAGILWGLGCLFVPLVSIIFLFVHWEDVRGTFLKYLMSIPLLIVAYSLTPPQYFSHF